MRVKFGSTTGPQTPVEQHMAGSKISIFFILNSSITILEYANVLLRKKAAIPDHGSFSLPCFCELTDAFSDFITDALEHGPFFFYCAFRFCRIHEAPVIPLYMRRRHR